MCIVSLYCPQPQEYILTHNRDEDYTRLSSGDFAYQKINNKEARFPVDLRSGGTWILQSGQWTTCMLNGAETWHKTQPPYRMSRGKFPLRLLEFNQISDYVAALDLEGVEPFTQLIIHNQNDQKQILTWNGKRKKTYLIQKTLTVLSSSTLYSEEKKAMHLNAFQSLHTPSADRLAAQHQKFLWEIDAEKPMIRTTSISQIINNKGLFLINYKKYSH